MDNLGVFSTLLNIRDFKFNSNSFIFFYLHLLKMAFRMSLSTEGRPGRLIETTKGRSRVGMKGTSGVATGVSGPDPHFCSDSSMD